MAKTYHLALDTTDFPDQWVDLFDPRFMSQRRFEEAVAAMRAAATDPKATEKFLRDRISTWNVLDADSGEPLGDPQSADLGGLPLGITKAISDKIGDLFEATIPNRSRNS